MAYQNDRQDGSMRDYIKKRKRLSGLFFEIALPNEYLVQIGAKKPVPVLGGKRARFFRRFLRIPAYVQTVHFSTDNANMDYQGIGIEGYASYRIDPARPEVAIATLDFFDEDDPMARTTQELKTICVEAVRHVIANMSIEDALRKKDDIAENLFSQLKEVERKWGIIFDQVGIEKVRIMSTSVFENLQASFRAGLRLDAEKKRIEVDKQITAEENILRERSGMEGLETDKKLESAKKENESRIRLDGIEQERQANELEQSIEETRYRKDIEFRMEKESKENELATKSKTLQAELFELDIKLLESSKKIEELKAQIGTKQLELTREKRQVEQVFSQDTLSKELIQKLPEIFKAVKIDNYSILDSSGGSPVARTIAELATVLKQSGLDLGALLPGHKGQEAPDRE